MHRDDANQYRQALENDPPAFVDRVDTPWDHVPDLPDYNASAYKRIVRNLKRLHRGGPPSGDGHIPTASSSLGVLVLGEAGTGKTHLLMRVARNLSDTNHILFVRKPNNEEAVAQHIWANIVSSLTRSLPTSGTTRSQLDDLLAHVFSDVLIPEFEKDIEGDVNAEQRQSWVRQLREDPYNLFQMAGEGERRQDNLRKIRNRTLRYLKVNHPDVDQRIAHALITYCFVSAPDRKRLLLTWLSGEDIDEVDAKLIGLPTSWVDVNESSPDTSIQQQREEQALRAIRTIGILSTHYQPLILAFDQLEGLRGEERLTDRWGDVVREIFTMTPNFLIVTCVFPSLWESWFRPKLEASSSQRISQQVVELEQFSPKHALAMLKTHLEPSFVQYRLPTTIFPFEEDDVAHLCFEAESPRVFIQKARRLFEAWLDGDEVDLASEEGSSALVTQQDIDAAIRNAYENFEDEERAAYGTEIPIEQDFFGRIRNITQTILGNSGERVEYDKASFGNYVMPPNLVVRSQDNGESLCIAVMNSVGNAFAARIRNLSKAMRRGDQFASVIVLRDRRCNQVGARSQEYIEELANRGGVFIQAGVDEITSLNALYDTVVAVEEHDLSVGSHEIDKPQFVQFLRSEGLCGKTQFFRNAYWQTGFMARALGSVPSVFPAPRPQGQEVKPAARKDATNKQPEPRQQTTAARTRPLPPPSQRQPIQADTSLAQVVIGDTVLDSTHLGLLGTLRDDGRRLAISLTKPQCMVVLGYMGSGKSYSLGVVIENALLAVPNLIQQTRPLCVVAFNYRRNPESRFEYGGFKLSNSSSQQVAALRENYGAEPQAVQTVNVFGYEPELARRRGEYGDLPMLPIQFRSDELGAEHWEILMKPPSPQAEYMDVIRDIIQKLFYQERLNFKNLEKNIVTDERLSPSQRRRAMNRLSFAERWVCDERPYEWGDLLQEGSLNVFDLRMQTMEPSEALKLCLIVTDLVRRTRNGVNKMVVFDEAHEYVDCKELIGELENAITQIRHDGLSFVLASQFPERIPERIFKYLLTRLIFKLPTQKAINYVRKAAPNLEALSPQRVSNLDLEQGVCFVQTDDDCTDPLLRVPQLLEVRTRCTQHSGATIRNVPEAPKVESAEAEVSDEDRTLADLHEELGIPWERFLKISGLPNHPAIHAEMTLREARQIGANLVS
jgi:hypothetical protein